MKHWYIFLLAVLWCVQAVGQEGGFNPSNPPEPGQRYHLTVSTMPAEGGWTSPSGRQQYGLGETVRLNAYANTGFHFAGWSQNGEVVSTESSYTYTIPAADSELTALFEFGPESPEEPSPVPLRHKLTLRAEPSGGGSFNISSGTLFGEGSTVRLQAYTETGFEFVGWRREGQTVSTDGAYSFVMGTEDEELTGVFRFNPANPGNPGANSWNKTTGELIVDDFVPGNIMSAVDAVIGGSGNRGAVTMVTVAGQMSSYDFGLVDYMDNCTLADLSRTGGYTEIPGYAFDGTALASVSLPACVERIGYRAFGNCAALTTLSCYAQTPPVLDNNVFEGVNDGLVVRVLASALPLYSEAEGWKDFTLLPLTEEVRSLEVNLPADSGNRYANTTLELINQTNGQKQRYVVTDRTVYTFNGLLRNCTYSVVLRSANGAELGRIDDIELDEADASVAFSSLKELLDVTLQVLLPDGTDVTGMTQVTWLDSAGTYLSQGQTLTGLVAGTKLAYRVALDEKLGTEYVVPAEQDYTVQAGSGNNPACRLEAIAQVAVAGRVTGEADDALSGAVVSVSQKLNGQYSKSFSTRTDARGNFSLKVYDAESTVSVSATDYVNYTASVPGFGQDTDLGVLRLEPISGPTVNLAFTYTPSVREGEVADTQSWYSDYENVAYSVYNETQGRAVEGVSVQYPSLVLTEGAEAGDRLRLTATSKTGSFLPVETTVVIAEDGSASATFPIVAWGGIAASYNTTDNASVTGMLYDARGELVGKYAYANSSLSIPSLPDGGYTLVTMAGSTFFNSVLRLSQLAASGLTEGTDYVQDVVDVKSGVIVTVSNESVPPLDESKLYYTGSNTAFTVNKASIVAGNYLTLKGQVDFREEYAGRVSDVCLAVDLPSSCSFVENSVMVGSQISGYTLDGNRLTIPFGEDHSEQIRFCVIPTAGGSFIPSAFVEFELDGKTVQQPIGSAYSEVKDLSITVPEVVAKTSVPISGTAVGKSEVEIYDNGILIGQTTALANGLWSTACELNEPYNLSSHSIYAKVRTPQGVLLQSETRVVDYDMNAIQVSSVTMFYDNPELNKMYEVTFDFQNPTSEAQKYTYCIWNKEFSFTINFTDNSPEKVSNVVLHVKTGDGNWRALNARYDAKKDLWVAHGEFGDNYDGIVPVNVSVEFDLSSTEIVLSEEMISDAYAVLTKEQENLSRHNQQTDSLHTLIVDERNKIPLDLDVLSSLYSQYFALISMAEPVLEETDTTLITDRELEVMQSEYDAFEAEYGTVSCDSLLTVSLSNIRYEVEESDISGIFAVSTCAGYTESQLGEEFEKIAVTNGSFLYVRSEEDSITILDFTNDVCYTVSSTTVGLMRASSSEDFVARMRAFIRELDKKSEKVRDIAGKIMDVVSKVEEHIQGGIKFAQEGGSAAYLQLLKLRRAQASGIDVSQNRIFLLEMIVDGYQAEYNGLKKLKQAMSQFNSKFYSSVFGGIGIISNLISCKGDLDKFINTYYSVPDPCEDDEAEADDIRNRIRIAGIAAGIYYVGNISGDVISLLSIGPSVAAAPATAGSSLGVALVAVGKLALSYGLQKAYEKSTEMFFNYAKTRIASLDCNQDDPDDDDGNNDNDGNNGGAGGSGNGSGRGTPSGNSDLDVSIDPSGFVYEAVESNRLAGVTATCYYKEMVEDMYGDLHEQVVLWNAADYAQQNPLFTDEMGMYRWDVPQGLWQVKFEKEGYQTTYSEWLPVPPPQLEVNIGMVQTAQPVVTAVRGYDTGVEIDFSKYMDTETLASDHIGIQLRGQALQGDISLTDAEPNPTAPGEAFASHLRFVPAEPLAVGDTVLVTVSRRVRSYAGIQMEGDYSQEVVISQEPRLQTDTLLQVPYGGTATLTVTVLPVAESAGRTLAVSSTSQAIASVQPSEVVMDATGTATFTVAGELLGRTALRLSVADMALQANVAIAVVEPEEEILTRHYDLVAGWNYVSFNLSDERLASPAALLSSLGEEAEALRGQDGELVRDDVQGGWKGTLMRLRPEQGYKLKLRQASTFDLEGPAAKTYEATLTLGEGWNWIGFVPQTEMGVGDAFAHLEADENDVVSSPEGFAVWDGTSWQGSLSNLLPGRSYLYYSRSLKSFNYPQEGASAPVPGGVSSAPWPLRVADFPDVMPLLASLMTASGEYVEAGRYVVGAFAGDQCRGISVEIEGRFYLPIVGEGRGQNISLRALDTMTGEEYAVTEAVTFDSTAVCVDCSAPMQLHLGKPLGIASLSQWLYLSPNPVRHVLYVRGGGLVQAGSEARIYNSAGAVCLMMKGADLSAGIDVSSLTSGLYFLEVQDAEGQAVRLKFLKVD